MEFRYFGNTRISDSTVLQRIKELDSGKSPDKFDTVVSDEIKSGLDTFCDGQNLHIVLKDQIGDAGGEGTVFLTNYPDLVAKIYHKSMRTELRHQKLNYMVANPVNDHRICWPKGVLYYGNEFVGIVMPRIDNKKYITAKLEDLAENEELLDHKRSNLIKILMNLCEVFEVLQSYHIVMGDVNFDNFFINPKTQDVIIIDMDGAQIDKFPCLTCKESFNCPELFVDYKDRDYEELENKEESIALAYYHFYYSTYARDNYALAVFIFKMLMANDPYLDLHELANLNFFYSVDDEQAIYNTALKNNEMTINRWAHLPKFVRRCFYKTFTTYDPNERLTPGEWKKYLKHYLLLLESNTYQTRDPQCEHIYFMDSIDFSYLLNTDFDINSTDIEIRSLSIRQCVKKLFNKLTELGEDFRYDLDSLAAYLKMNNEYTFEHSKIEVIYDIGVLKKIHYSFE